MDKLLAKLDFIVSPATPIPAFEVGPEIPGDVILDRGVNAGSFAFPINLSQQPAISTPCGLTAAGLQVLARVNLRKKQFGMSKYPASRRET